MPWFTCDVTRAGPAENGTIYLGLRDVGGTFPSRWFQAVPQMEKEMLATALTAVSTGKRVRTSIADTAAYSTVNRLYIIA